MSTWSYTKGADRSNKAGKYAPSLRVGKGHDYDHLKKKSAAKKKKIKYKKTTPSKNEAEMKLASRLYKKLKKEPDFKYLPWKELWDMAIAEVKRNAK